MNKILLCTYYDGNSHEGKTFKEIGDLTEPSKIEYCKTHGYDFYSRTENNRTDRNIGWERIQLICDYIDKYDYIFYTDCDLFLANHTIKVEDLIDDNYDVIISKNFKRTDWIETNTGAFLVKCSDWNKEFFNKLNNRTEFFGINEHVALMDELNYSQEVQKHFKIIPYKGWNSMWHVWYPERNFTFGDFCLHDCGTSNNHRFQLFTELQNKIIKDKSTDYSNWEIETPQFL